jgi:APA family basic amino acid/polyamine antiporter
MVTTSFVRVLGRRDVVTLAFGAMIGWSWVLLTGDWLTRAGTLGALLAFVTGGTAVVFIGLTYAELVSAMPLAGGEHVYTQRAFGRAPSFICTWALLMGYLTVPTFEAVALPTAAEYLFPAMKTGYLWTVGSADVHASFVLVGVASAAVMTAINVIGIRVVTFMQSMVTLLFFLIGLFFLTGAFSNGSTANAEPLLVGGAAGTLGVLIMVPTLLVGFDVIPQSAEEIDLPFRDIGKLLVISVALAVLWYLLVSLGVALVLQPELRATSTMGTADATAVAWGGQWAGNLMVIGGIGGILTSWNAFIVGGSRVLYALAHSGMLPPVFADLHPRFRTPWKAVLFIGLLTGVAPLFGRTILVWLIDAGSFAIVIAYTMVAAAFLRLRAREPDMPRPFRVPAGRVVGWTALLLSGGLFTLYLPWSPSALIWPWEWAIALGWMVLGAAFYRPPGDELSHS